MGKFLRNLIIVFSGVIIGLLIYNQFQASGAKQTENKDTSFVSKAYASHTDTASENRQNAITRAVERVTPAVVSVNVIKIKKYIRRSPFADDPFMRRFFPEYFGDRVIKQPVEIVGSGFIISEDGYIVTNEHVAGNAEELIIATGDGKEYKGKLIGADHVADVALIKIDQHSLPFVRFGNSDDLLIGEWAIALGNPFGLFVRNKPTVTVGVISAENRNFSPIEGRNYENMIQTDAAINSGNSGGPLCNADGLVIGMNTFIYTGGSADGGSLGIGFAIPASRIISVVEKLKKRGTGDKDFWLGMKWDNLNAYVSRILAYPFRRGIFVRQIHKNGPAEKAGIQLGDIILSINGQTVNSVSAARQLLEISDLRVGDKLQILIWREAKQMQTTLILEKYPQ